VRTTIFSVITAAYGRLDSRQLDDGSTHVEPPAVPVVVALNLGMHMVTGCLQ
jgi:hypothetical protein